MKEESILDTILVIGFRDINEGQEKIENSVKILKINLFYHKITSKKSSVEFQPLYNRTALQF